MKNIYLQIEESRYHKMPALNASTLKKYLEYGEALTQASMLEPIWNKNALVIGSALHDHVLLDMSVEEAITVHQLKYDHNRLSEKIEIDTNIASFNHLVSVYDPRHFVKTKSQNTDDVSYQEIVLLGSYGNLKLKARIDFVELYGDHCVLGDLKSTAKSSSIDCGIKKYKYWEQMMFYKIMHQLNRPEIPVQDLKLVFVSKDPKDKNPCVEKYFSELSIEEQRRIETVVRRAIKGFYDGCHYEKFIGWTNYMLPKKEAELVYEKPVRTQPLYKTISHNLIRSWQGIGLICLLVWVVYNAL
jgi:PDDEXK-like domain of unknown function (DUF3799)